jgi:hypothetical protein
MRIIDADKYRKELLSAYDDVSMEFEVLDRQPLVSAIPIPEGATNGEVVEKIFGKSIYYTLFSMMYVSCCEKLKKWWYAPYKGNLSEKPTGSESKSRGCGICHYNDGVVHAECVLCGKAGRESE